MKQETTKNKIFKSFELNYKLVNDTTKEVNKNTSINSQFNQLLPVQALTKKFRNWNTDWVDMLPITTTYYVDQSGVLIYPPTAALIRRGTLTPVEVITLLYYNWRIDLGLLEEKWIKYIKAEVLYKETEDATLLNLMGGYPASSKNSFFEYISTPESNVKQVYYNCAINLTIPPTVYQINGFQTNSIYTNWVLTPVKVKLSVVLVNPEVYI